MAGPGCSHGKRKESNQVIYLFTYLFISYAYRMNIDIFISIHFTKRGCTRLLGGKCFTT